MEQRVLLDAARFLSLGGLTSFGFCECGLDARTFAIDPRCMLCALGVCWQVRKLFDGLGL